MREKWNPNEEFNIAEVSLKEFMAYYNRTIPAVFPQATEKALRKFKSEHESLFEDGADWSIDKHRKKLMDWLPSYKEPTE